MKKILSLVFTLSCLISLSSFSETKDGMSVSTDAKVGVVTSTTMKQLKSAGVVDPDTGCKPGDPCFDGVGVVDGDNSMKKKSNTSVKQ